VVIALGIAYKRLSLARTEAEISRANEVAARADVEKSAAFARRETEIAKEQAQRVAASAQVLSSLNGEAVAAAVSSQSAPLLPRVYMQIVNPNDRDRANQIKERLTAAGILVLGIEYVPQAARLTETDVRYYRKADEPEAQKIADVLKDAGVASTQLKYLKGYENSTKIRPNHFEVWLASGTQVMYPFAPPKANVPD
jgi:arginine utilization protein RocB